MRGGEQNFAACPHLSGVPDILSQRERKKMKLLLIMSEPLINP